MSIVVTYFGENELSFIKGRVLSTWDSMTKTGLSDVYRHIKFYEDIEAFKCLADCALGLTSVTIGDSQVLAQVCDSLSYADEHQSEYFRIFRILVELFKKIAKESKRITKLYSGNVSLERTACELIANKLSEESSIVVLGAGMTGSLIAKILSSDYGRKIYIANRSSEKLDRVINKYPNTSKIDLYNIKQIALKNFIIIALSSSENSKQYVVEFGMKQKIMWLLMRDICRKVKIKGN